MEQHNPYQQPNAHLEPTAMRLDGFRLATRGARFGAALVDGLVALVVIGPIMFFGGYFDSVMAAAARGQTDYGAALLWGVIGMLLFFALQFLPLKASGQTWGKKAVGIRIVDMDGNKPGLGVLLGRRYLFSNGVGLIPFVGPLVQLVDALMIFGSDQRCLHDLVAGTRVVEGNR